jgi:translation initiation factor IF-3
MFKKKLHKLNSEVRYDQVRVIEEGKAPLITTSYEASKIAQDQGKDLILINENANPPVVRIEDYQKFLYNFERSEKEKRKNTSKNETKEIQLSCTIASNDLNTKSKKALEFLEDGSKVKCVVQLKGRQKAMPEQGELVLLKFAEILSDIGQLEFLPKLEGGRWLMIIKPKKKK